MRVVFILLAILILTSISSCSGWKTNFNTQKYTSLNKIKQKNHETFDTLNNIAGQNAHEKQPETATTVNYIESQNTITLENANNETHTVQSDAIMDNSENLRDEQIKFRPLLPLIQAKGNYWSRIDWNQQDNNPNSFSKKNISAPGKGLPITFLILSLILLILGLSWVIFVNADGSIVVSLVGLLGTIWATILLKNWENRKKKQKSPRKKKNKRIALGVGLFLIAVFLALLVYVSMELGGIEVAIALTVATMAILALSIHQFIRAIKGDKKKKTKANSKVWGIIVLTLGCILMVLGPLLIMAVSAYWIPIFFFLLGLMLAIIGGIMIKKSI